MKMLANHLNQLQQNYFKNKITTKSIFLNFIL